MEVGFYERDRIDKLGTYFVYHNVLSRYGFTFEQFVKKVDNGSWDLFVRSQRYVGQ